MNEKKIRNCIFVMAAVCLVVFVICGCITYYVDPFFHYHAPIKGFPYQVDNQLTQNPGMASHMDYDSVILGSSMTVNFETDDFRDLMGLNTLKLSYSSAYPKDISNITQKVLFDDKGNLKPIKAVFLGLDIITYSGDVNETKYPLPKYLYDKNPINDINYLLNKDVLLNYILRPMADPEPTNLSHVYASWWTDDYYNEDWVIRNHVIPEKVETPMDRYEFCDPIRANLDANIIPYIEASPDTEFYIFFPPYSILFWYNVKEENHLDATMESYRTVYEALKGYDNVKMFFFPAMEDVVTDLNNYADYSHYHPRFNKLMVECFVSGDHMIKKSPDDPDGDETMDEYIDDMYGIIERYDFKALEEKLDKWRQDDG